MPPQGILATTPARSQVNLVVEANTGEQPLIAQQAVASSITVPSQPTGGVTGYRLHAQVINQTASGTITIVGVDLTGASQTEVITVPAQPSQRLQSAQIGAFDYCTVTIFNTITSISTTGMTNGLITIGYVQAGKYLLSAHLKTSDKRTTYSPNEQSGLIEKDTKILQQTHEVTIGELSQDLYPDSSLWWPHAHLGLPNSMPSIPASPVSLLAATSLAGSPLSLTTQPSLPAMKLILTITSFSVAGTITIAGTNRYNQPVSEIMAINANGTYYSSSAYSNVSSITNSGTTATIAVAGVYGWQLSFISSGNQQTFALEHFDGSGSYVYPFSYFTEGEFDLETKGQAKLSSKGMAQNKIPIGSRNTDPLTTNRITPLSVPVELPVVGWQTALWLDSITMTPGTTLISNGAKLKLQLKTPVEARWNLTNKQEFNRAFSQKREMSVELQQDLYNLIAYEMYRQNLKQYLVSTIYGENIGTVSGTTYYKSWTWTLPIKYDGEYSPDSDPGKSAVELTNKFSCEYDSGIGAGWKLVVVTQQPPIYNL